MSTAKSRTTSAGARTVPAAVTSAVEAARSKKAVDLQVLDLRALSSFTDFFVICSGANTRQVRAIANAVEESLGAAGVEPAHIEGYARADWVLLDYFDFIVHVFSTERREFYALERLWGSAEHVSLPERA